MDQPAQYGTTQEIDMDIFQQNENTEKRSLCPDDCPKDYFWLAFITTLCCCFPVGTVAIVRSSEVRLRFGMGDMNGSYEASRRAKYWSITGISLGLLVLAIKLALLTIYSAKSAYPPEGQLHYPPESSISKYLTHNSP